MKFNVVIPARYSSSRLPGKPLVEIAGKPMIEHVYERAKESAATEIVIATDDSRIQTVAEAFGATVCMTAAGHASGSDRIAEVVDTLGWSDETVIVNLQGDEPCMPAELIDQVGFDMNKHAAAGMTTLATPIVERQLLFDPHVVKVVRDAEGYALYFSRAPIPWHRDEFMGDDGPLPTSMEFLRHIGLYAYRAGFLRKYVQWSPSDLEQAEALEQLRVLSHGGRIHVDIAVKLPGHGVDTRDDIKRVEPQLEALV